MRKLFYLGTLIFLLTGLAACQSWYKRGAGGEQLATDQRQCKTSSGADFTDCMQAAGWRTKEPSKKTVEQQKPQKPVPVPAALPLPAAESHDTRNTPIEEPTKPTGAWFKFGASAEQLQHDQAGCQNTAQVDDTTAPLFTDCMHSKGWRAIGTR